MRVTNEKHPIKVNIYFMILNISIQIFMFNIIVQIFKLNNEPLTICHGERI